MANYLTQPWNTAQSAGVMPQGNIMDALKQLGGVMQGLGAQDSAYRNQQHMNAVFAANPEFAQQLYGAQNEQTKLSLLQEQERRKRAQEQALKQLAGQIGQSPTFDRQKALAQYGAITGDLSSLLGVSGSNIPAPIQIANEIARRRAAGDIEGAKLLELSAKLGDKGTYTDPTTGEVKVLPGYAPSVATIEKAKSDAANISDMTYDPITAGKTEASKLEQKLKIEPDIAAATKEAEVGVQKQFDAPKAQARLNATLAKSRNVVSSIDKAISQVGPTTAGAGAMISGIPSTGAKDLSETLKTIKANLGFDELQEMRNNSPTGGALGNVATQEIEFLQSVVASLDQAQSPQQLLENLQIAKDAKIASDARIKAAYDADFAKYGQMGESVNKVIMPAETPRQKLNRLRAQRAAQ